MPRRIGFASLLLIVARLALITPGTSHAEEPIPAELLLLNRAAIERARQSCQSNQVPMPAAVPSLIKDANAALQRDLVSVTQKQQIPPSGSKHDYMSLAPYWWPDPAKPDGLPYIRRDGEVNPEYRRVGDSERIDEMVQTVTTLALAYAISGDERYARRAVQQVKEWFLNPSTRMNPHLQYAQAIRGVNQGRGIGIIETYCFRQLIDALVLLQGSEDWTDGVEKGMRAWLTSYLTWLQDSPNGRAEAGWKNNHGSAYDVQVVCLALYLGKTGVAEKVLQEVGARRIVVQIDPDGSQPLELERTKSWGYANMNLAALVELGILGDRVGVDLWHFTTADGRSLRKAVDFLLPYATGAKKWTWTQLDPLRPNLTYYALRIAGTRYHDESYAAAAATVADDSVRSSRLMFSLPPDG